MQKFRHALAALLACTTVATAEPLNIVTDIAPLQSLVAQVTGELGEPVLLLSGRIDPHHAQLRPSQARALSRADLIFWIGPELTPWLENGIARIAANTPTLGMLKLDGTHIRRFPGGKFIDPHVWLDPENANVWLDEIAAALARQDPENAAIYQNNARLAQQDLKSLTAKVSKVLAPALNGQIITAHDAYGYFADRFDLNIVATLTDGDAAKPGAAHISDLRNILAEGNITCVFGEVGQDSGLADVITKGTGVRIALLDPTGINLVAGADLYHDLISGMANEIAGCVATAD